MRQIDSGGSKPTYGIKGAGFELGQLKGNFMVGAIILGRQVVQSIERRSRTRDPHWALGNEVGSNLTSLARGGGGGVRCVDQLLPYSLRREEGTNTCNRKIKTTTTTTTTTTKKVVHISNPIRILTKARHNCFF